MPETPLTMSLLAGLEIDSSGTGLSADERQKVIDNLETITRELPQLTGHELGERLLGFLTKSLQKPVGDVLAEVWKQRREMREAAAKGVDGRDVEAEVELVTHYMSCELHPSVELEINGKGVGTLTFDVDVSLKLEGVQLVIRNARITSVKAGTLTSMLDLKCRGLPLMATRKKTVDLPWALTLPAGGLDLAPRHPSANR